MPLRGDPWAAFHLAICGLLAKADCGLGVQLHGAARWRHSTLVKCQCGIWHLRTSDLLEVEGSVRTARQGSEVKDAEDRKIDQVESELGRYGAVVGALQETKWFGDEMYKVGESAWS